MCKLVAVSAAGEGNSTHFKRHILSAAWIRKGEKGNGKNSNAENTHNVQSKVFSLFLSPPYTSVIQINEQKNKAAIPVVPLSPELF